MASNSTRAVLPFGAMIVSSACSVHAGGGPLTDNTSMTLTAISRVAW